MSRVRALRDVGARGEVAVIGLGASGRAAARLLARAGAAVYASDAGKADAVAQSAAALGADGIAAEAGRHDLARIGRAGMVVVSPGVPPDAPPLVAARAAGVPVISEVELALRALPGVPYVGVTGTNGKTTTTALIAHLLRALGHETVEAGNIGTPLADVALTAWGDADLREAGAAMAGHRPDWMALELSSFQLHDTPSVAPTVAVLTNLAPDHLDRYASLEAYYGDKDRLFANAAAGSTRVVNADDAEVLRRTAGVPGTARTFSLRDPAADAWYDAANRRLMLAGEPLLDRALLPLLGDHNVANALAAALAVWWAHPAHRTADARRRLAEGLTGFRAIKHRLEPVGEIGGVLWINDSKATNIGAARVALEGMTRPTILLLGGRHKGEPYTAMLDAVRDHAKVVLAFGEAAPLIEADLAAHVPLERLGSSFEQVIARARALAAPGDVVLLAPACSSYDMFKNYEDRGATFRRLALGS
ncbi:MAG: UDP-N-acetylmuramoyl-L-alanine--D-glutamate ligase [Gemmatimonadaceae bacterium]|nr:UDP-N-acetylmuramoyl-L-alanine--D-glutamate ligase [Gemmatimonadaceae bacterium]